MNWIETFEDGKRFFTSDDYSEIKIESILRLINRYTGELDIRNLSHWKSTEDALEGNPDYDLFDLSNYSIETVNECFDNPKEALSILNRHLNNSV